MKSSVFAEIISEGNETRADLKKCVEKEDGSYETICVKK